MSQLYEVPCSSFFFTAFHSWLHFLWSAGPVLSCLLPEIRLTSKCFPFCWESGLVGQTGCLLQGDSPGFSPWVHYTLRVVALMEICVFWCLSSTCAALGLISQQFYKGLFPCKHDLLLPSHSAHGYDGQLSEDWRKDKRCDGLRGTELWRRCGWTDAFFC